LVLDNLCYSPKRLEVEFCELRLYRVLGSSRFAGIVFLSQEGGMGVARLKDSPPSEARMIAECKD
jgi:hypothetical protein